MAVNFGRPLLAIDAEKRAYGKMTTFDRIVEPTFENIELHNWKSKKQINIGEDKAEKLECSSGYNREEGKFSMSCGKMDHFEYPISWRGHGKRISEIRYGDIDKDGDIDIAVKLTNGAIYVFHNLAEKKEAQTTRGVGGGIGSADFWDHP